MSERVARALERIKIVYPLQKAPKAKERKERQLAVYVRKGLHFLRIVLEKGDSFYRPLTCKLATIESIS
jgi:hypothetical protein